jgi:hypothetical protein
MLFCAQRGLVLIGQVIGSWPAKVWFLCEVPSVVAFLRDTLNTILTAVGLGSRWCYPDGLTSGGNESTLIPIVVERSLSWDRRSRLRLITGCGAIHVYSAAVAPGLQPVGLLPVRSIV